MHVNKFFPPILTVLNFSRKKLRFLPTVFTVWLLDGAAGDNIPSVIYGDSEEVSSDPPRARAPPGGVSCEERGFCLMVCASSSPAKGSGE